MADVEGASDDLRGDIVETAVVGPGVGAELVERVGHLELLAFGDHALGLLDDDPAREGVVELIVDGVGFGDLAVLQDGDRGDVGEGAARRGCRRRSRLGVRSGRD